MTEYIKKSDAEAALLDLRKGYRRVDEKCAVGGCILEIRDLPAEDVVSRGVLEQVMWERDIAIRQLESYGVSLGEKADVTKMRHGYWVLDDFTHQYRCSVCNVVQPYDTIEDLIDPNLNYYDYWDCNYCPNCGTKMDLRGDTE